MTFDQRAWLWPLLLVATIITLSGTAEIATPDIGLQFSKDKLAHFLVFGLLATSILRVPVLRKRGWRGAAVAALVTTAFGAFDEIRQSLTPGRMVEVADWLADALGALVAVSSYRLITLYRETLERPIFVGRRHRPPKA
jgi:VanZ family protein